MAYTSFEDVTAYLESKLADIQNLPIDSAYFQTYNLVGGPFAGMTLLAFTAYSKAQRQPLLRNLRHMLRDAPCRVQVTLIDVDKKPKTGGFLGFPFIESQQGWG